MGIHATTLEGLVKRSYELLQSSLNEKQRRHFAGAQARALGHGGIKLVAQATGLAVNTVRAGVAELDGAARAEGRVRSAGGGRKKITTKLLGLEQRLEELVCPATRGDPMNPLRWTCKSTTRLAAELQQEGYKISQRTVCELLHKLGYSLQALRKTREGKQHVDRNGQFEYIARETRAFQLAGQPVISVDTKKKELIGEYKNGGVEWRPKGNPEEANTHDFPDKELGKVAPYGVYDISRNEGWVSVGVDHDTASFAVESIRRWWREMGQAVYPRAERLLITADCGGSNSYRTRLWKVELQKLADDLKLKIEVRHFPPGTSKWNKIEHRMFCHITQNWRGRKLTSRQVVVELIGHTETKGGLKIRAGLDEGIYPTGVEVSEEEMTAVQLQPCNFHGEWNYSITPHEPSENIK